MIFLGGIEGQSEHTVPAVDPVCCTVFLTAGYLATHDTKYGYRKYGYIY